MLFPYAFRKAYLCNPSGSTLIMQTSGTTDTIQKGQFGFCTAPNGIEGSFISSGTATTIKMVTGSWNTVDKIAPFYGGLTAPIYSKAIDPRRVTRFIKSTAAVAKQEIVSIGWSQSAASSTGPVFYCGTPYYLRLDFLGSPALRLLNHQIYINLPAFGGCCGTDCSSGCTSTAVDPVCIMLQWKDYINYGTMTGTDPASTNTQAGEIPYLNQFFTPKVYYKSGSGLLEAFSAQDVLNGNNINSSGSTQAAYTCNTVDPTSVIASFQLTGAYVDTKFGNCTFTPSDYFEIEPITVQASLLTQDYSPCPYNTTINTSVPNMFTVLQAPVYPKGLGEQVIRELILSERYRQNSFPDSIYVDSFRMRETENMTWLTTNVDRNAYYDVIGIAYNIYRPDNSQGLHDNDQYFELIYVPTGTNTTNFTNLFQACLTAAGSNVTLENGGTTGI